MTDEPSGGRVDAVIAFLLAAVTIAVYWPVLACDFVNFDDPAYVQWNFVVEAGLTLDGLKYAWTTFTLGNWIPLTWVSFELDSTLFGLQPWAFHGINLVFHTVNVILLYHLLRRMTRSIGPSAAVALLFALHPLHVESVAWVSERKDVLSTFWLLLALLAYEWYARKPSSGRMAVVGLMFTLGLLSKPMLVTLPILLLLIDYWPLRRLMTATADYNIQTIYPTRSFAALAVEKLPLLALSLADGIITIIAQGSAQTMSIKDPLLVRVANATYGCGWYLWKTIWPTGLGLFYPLPLDGTPWQFVCAAALALTTITAYVFWQYRHGHLLFGWAWFLVALLPVSGLLQVGGQAHADRYSYVPHIGLFILIVWEIGRWLPTGRAGQMLGSAACTATAIPLALLTGHQIETWTNSETLWTHALKLNPDNYGAHYMLSVHQLSQRHFNDAEHHVRRVMALRPDYDRAILVLGVIHSRRLEWLQAEDCFLQILQKYPHDAEATHQLAKLRRNQLENSYGRPQRSPPSPEAVDLNRKGLAKVRRGEMQAALQLFRQSISHQPDYAEAYNNAALALCELRRFDEAKENMLRAIDIEPDNGDYHVNLASALFSLGEKEHALKHFKTAVRLKPRDVEAQKWLQKLEETTTSP